MESIEATSRLPDISMLAASIATPLALGAAGGVVTARALPGWYAGLAKPAWNPPGWVFGPVWAVLYTMMGVEPLGPVRDNFGVYGKREHAPDSSGTRVGALARWRAGGAP